METLIRPNYNNDVVLNVTPESAGWNHLSFKVVALKAGQTYLDPTQNNEMALVPLAGRALCTVEKERFELNRNSVFNGLPHVLYVPPGSEIRVEAQTDFNLPWAVRPPTVNIRCAYSPPLK